MMMGQTKCGVLLSAKAVATALIHKRAARLWAHPAMLNSELIHPEKLLKLFERIKNSLIRFSSVEPELLRQKVEALVQQNKP